MANYSAIRDGLKTRLKTSTVFIQVADTAPDTVSPPCAIVLPGSPVVEYHQAFGNGLERFSFTILVLAQRFDVKANQDLIDGMVSGSSSVRALIEGDRTLGGNCSDCQVTSASTYGDVSVNETEYLGIEFEVEVYA